MAKLYLKFEQSVLKEFSLAQGGAVTIGRMPDNTVHIDNPAVSGHHAKLLFENGAWVIEDNNSTNGTYVNNRRISRVPLHDGDQVLVGKHVLLFQDEARTPADKPPAIAVPSLEATVVLDTRKAKEMIAQAAQSHSAGQGPAAAAVKARDRIGMLTVIEGKTDESTYVLSAKLSVIGKSEMASIKLKGWFAPKVAAVINHRDSRYFIAPSERNVKVLVNDEKISGQTELAEGDVIEVAKVKMSFAYTE
jgi:pSer/pThr/pTyr-binding forkhead associated (FHA) protein